MTADVELLPLPEHLRRSYKGMQPGEHAVECRLYARANVAHATAAKDAEIEALRAERDLFRDETITLVRQNGEWQARAERLAEALRGLAAYFQHYMCIPEDMQNDEDAEARRHLQDATAALHPTAAQEGKE